MPILTFLANINYLGHINSIISSKHQDTLKSNFRVYLVPDPRPPDIVVSLLVPQMQYRYW